MQRIPGPTAGLLAFGVLASACSVTSPVPANQQVVDDDGTAVLVSSAPAWPAGRGWHLAVEPELVIGEATDDPDLLVAQAMGAVRLDDGAVVLADQETRLRWFDAEGSLLLDAGGKGEGPGEFEFIFRIDRCADDRLHVTAPGDQISVYTLAGEFQNRTTWDFAVGPHQTACDRQGNVVATGLGGFPQDIPATGAMLHRADTELMILPAGEQESFNVRPVPSAERVWFARGAFPHPFGRMTLVAIGSGSVYMGLAETFEIEVFDLDGQLTRRIRRADLVPQAVAIDDLERLADLEPERLSDSALESARQADLPPTFPAYDRLVVDPTGALWVRNFRRAGAAEARWSVFEDSGAWLGDVVVPSRLQVLEIGADYVLGIWRDELDEESVRVYALLKP